MHRRVCAISKQNNTKAALRMPTHVAAESWISSAMVYNRTVRYSFFNKQPVAITSLRSYREGQESSRHFCSRNGNMRSLQFSPSCWAEWVGSIPFDALRRKSVKHSTNPDG